MIVSFCLQISTCAGMSVCEILHELKTGKFDFTWYLCDVPVHAYTHFLVMVR